MIRVVVGILRRADKWLIAQRPFEKPYAGYWEFAGGKIEANETSWDALIRELHEELGIRVISAQYWFESKHDYPDRSVLLDMWLVKRFSGEPYSKESQTLRWVTTQELLNLRLLEGNRAILDKILLFSKELYG
jgi:8-oxo-dGTP diphosphatase